MDPEALNLSIRKFLKMVGVSSQREIEQAVRKALQENTISGNEAITAVLTLEIPTLGVRVPFDGDIRIR